MEKIHIKCAPQLTKHANQIIRCYFPGWPF